MLLGEKLSLDNLWLLLVLLQATAKQCSLPRFNRHQLYIAFLDYSDSFAVLQRCLSYVKWRFVLGHTVIINIAFRAAARPNPQTLILQ